MFKLAGADPAKLARHAFEAGAITAEELALLERRATLRDKVVRVDDFPQDFAHEAAPVAPHLKAAA